MRPDVPEKPRGLSPPGVLAREESGSLACTSAPGSSALRSDVPNAPWNDRLWRYGRGGDRVTPWGAAPTGRRRRVIRVRSTRPRFSITVVAAARSVTTVRRPLNDCGELGFGARRGNAGGSPEGLVAACPGLDRYRRACGAAHGRESGVVVARCRGEEQTARLLVELQARGWVVWHDLMLWGRRFNLDHILISPCGTVVVVLDTKAWRRTWTTGLVYGRVHCGPDDRHSQIEKVASYAQAVAAVAGLHPAVVRPLIVVHGSPVAGGFLEAMTPHGPVHVLSPGFLVPTLLKAPGVPDAWRARALAEQVERVLAPFAGRG